MNSRRQAGFIPGMVMEINMALVVLAVAVGILLPASQFKFRPVTIEPKPVEFVAPAAASASLPAAWAVAPSAGAFYIGKLESPWTMWIVLLLFIATVVSVFVAALYWPYWAALVVLCATWWYGVESLPGSQSVKITADGAVELRGFVRFAAPLGGIEKIGAKEVETVLVDKGRPIVYVVFQRDKKRLGWRIYAESQAEAQAIAALVQSNLKPPPAQPARR